jgi:hypothetical protein
VLLLRHQHVGQQLARAVVAELDAERDAPVEALDCLQLHRQVEAQLLDRLLAQGDRPEALEVRHALQEDDPLDQLLGVLHLVDRLVLGALRQLLVAPVLLHLGVPEVLVDGRQLGGQHLVEQLDDLGASLHARRPPGGADVTGRRPSAGTVRRLAQPAPVARAWPGAR